MSNIMKDFNTGKQAFHDLDTISDSTSSLEKVRLNIVHSVPIVQRKQANLTEAIKKVNETYSQQVAVPKIDGIRATYNSEVKTIQDKLRSQLKSVMTAKREACRKYTMTPPTQEQLDLFSSYKMRDPKSISDEEWNMLIATVAGNYQCSQILCTLAKEAGREFFPPVSSLKDIESNMILIEAWLNNAINDLEKPDDVSYRTMELLAVDNKNTALSQIIDKLDKEIITTVPSADLTLKNRLRASAQHALHVGNNELFNEICHFIGYNNDKLMTPQEMQADFINKAEQLIEKGMSATEARK